ncbi:MAG: hypothetical protein JWM47_1537 [Acidimicrobiales bacterium]|nr:hypothetical protein [Acidimicrobiales bacterium]
MTVRVTTLKGPEAGRYYVEALGGYYLDCDEPEGVWRGRGAGALGLTGTLDDDDFLGLMAGLDPNTGNDLGSRHTERTVRGFDVTCSAPKSLSVLFAVGDDHTRGQVLAAHDAAVAAMVDWIERHAHCRHRVNGEIWTVDAQGIAAAQFRQHTSRELDPQIHTHVVIANRVIAPDGRWLALDGRTIKRDQRTLSAIYHAGLRAELTERLGVHWHEPTNGIAEMADMDPAVLEEFSTRTRAVQNVLDRKVDRFTDTLGRDPTPRERWALEREAVLASRPTKTSADAPTLHQEWAERLAGLGVEPERLVRSVVGRARPAEVDLFTAGRIQSQAIESLSEHQSTWRAAEIDREVARAVPTTTGARAAEVVACVEELSAEIERDLVVDMSPAGPTPALPPTLAPDPAPGPISGPGSGPISRRVSDPASDPGRVSGRAGGPGGRPGFVPDPGEGPVPGPGRGPGHPVRPAGGPGSVPDPVEGPAFVHGFVPVRRDRRPVTESAVDRILTTAEILAQEDQIVTRAQRRVDAGGHDHHDLGDHELAGVQHEVAAAVAGTRELVLVVGPAGTGKTTALRPAVGQLRRDGRAAFGVTPSATAADVLATDTGMDADTIDKLLIEHRLNRPPEHRYALPAGATIVVDEAAMVSTPALLELFDLADRQRWRLALVGDPMQFAAVGRSGMFGHLVDTFGAIELDRVHRFHEPWEREASLALRRGDPEVVTVYDVHGRLHGGTGPQMRRAILDAWWQAEEAGERAAMMAPTNDAVVRLNDAAQFRRLDTGQLDGSGPSLQVGQYRLYEGDRVASRRNDRRIRTDRGQMVKNRDHWTVDEIHADGSIDVVGRTGRAHLSPEYAATNVELAYAETSHANQGRTVDRSFLYLDGPADSRGVYVPLTRGRLANEAFVVTEGEATAADIVAEAVVRTWVDTPAITHRREPEVDRRPDDRGLALRGPGEGPVLAGPELRAAVERRHAVIKALNSPLLDGRGTRRARADLQRTEDELVQALVSVSAAERGMTESKATVDRYPRPIDRLAHRRQIAAAEETFERSIRALRESHPAVDRLTAQRRSLVEDVRAREEAQAHQPQLEAQQRHLDHVLTADRTRWVEGLAGPELEAIVARLGPPPAGPTAAGLWQQAAGHIVQHREAFGIEGGPLLGPAPERWRWDANALSHRAAEELIEDLDRALGRTLARPPLQIEPPGLSL